MILRLNEEFKGTFLTSKHTIMIYLQEVFNFHSLYSQLESCYTFLNIFTVLISYLQTELAAFDARQLQALINGE